MQKVKQIVTEFIFSQSWRALAPEEHKKIALQEKKY